MTNTVMQNRMQGITPEANIQRQPISTSRFAGEAGDFEVDVENHDPTEDDGELLHAERAPAHVFRRHFRHVHRRHGGGNADRQPADDAVDDEP